jgi:hypothetical protein
LPSCCSSSASSSAVSEREVDAYPAATAHVDYTHPYERVSTTDYPFDLHDQYETDSQVASSASSEDDCMWPYDGKGLYEHHSKRDCGQACYVSCRVRRKYRPSKRRFAALARFVPWLGKRGGEQVTMMNSDVPHPPWTLQYRSVSLGWFIVTAVLVLIDVVGRMMIRSRRIMRMGISNFGWSMLRRSKS